MRLGGWGVPTWSPGSGGARCFDAVRLHPLASASCERSRGYLLWRARERAPIDLSIRCLRQIRADMESLRDEMLLQQTGAVAPQRSLVDALGHDVGGHGFAQQVVGDADDGRLPDGRVGQQRLFDLAWRHLL